MDKLGTNEKNRIHFQVVLGNELKQHHHVCHLKAQISFLGQALAA